MSDFFADVIRHDPRFLSPGQIRDTQLLEPITRAAVAAVVAEAAAMGIALQVTETFRSQARQAQLFARRATQLEKVGVHHYGLACDFARIEDGKADWNAADWTFLGPLAAKHGLVWGGDWSLRDLVHVQRVAVADQNKLFSGAWYPDENYSPQGTR